MSNPRRAARAALLAGCASLALALSGCVNPFDLFPPPSATSTPHAEDVPEELRPYFEQAIVWEPCSNRAQCATVRAPLDWEDPGAGEDVELALTRHPALDGSPQGSLFFNPGGPGVSGADYVRDYPEYIVSEAVRDDFDLVGWDPRGVGSSSAVTCYTDPRDFDEFLFGIPDASTGTPEWVAEVDAVGADFARACAENTGELLAHVDTLSTVRDLDLLRALVGDERLNYFGMSYGTQIGAQYADMFPERVGRMVLDGVVDPSLTLFEVVREQTRGFDRALRGYLAACSADDCPFSGDADADIARIAELFTRLDAQPLPHDDGRMLDSAVLDIAISAALYEEQYWPTLTQAFVEVLAGETETTFALADSYYGRVEGEYQDSFFESFIAITCADYPVESDPAVLAQQASELAAITPLAAEVPMRDPVCGNWPYPAQDVVGPVRGAGAEPILLIGTAGDPATPYESAVSVAEQLESGVLLSYNGDDHIAYDEGDPCINDRVDSYLLTGAVPAADPRCGF